ncbi:MarR family transcriptional regulator [Paenibacillus aquistagni]|uniref:DNA-binding transcriptional regulator, MarR family n=1 Tax=Paenibacillus aquistagni TaxID=1852522 RepID=A0A1X7K0H5_9BACL|nr:MarR family transcriptional regulator [Paenibacillus aquistagni]SMG33694.1 DNA-binding transcriptional regulator, MarR family [Paenibacillus aquistagni]
MSDLNIDKELTWLISDHMTEYVIAFAKIIDNEVSASQYFILQTIEESGPKTSSELAALLGVSLPAITNLTNKLETKGYVERQVMHEDRRNIRVMITAQGKAIVERMQEKHCKLSESLLTTFSQEEKERLVLAYRKMIQVLKQEAGMQTVDREKAE